MANGTTLNGVISEIGQSDEAGTQISNFLNDTLGEVSDDLIHAGQTMLTGITQAYETVKNYTSDQLQAAANGFQATFSSAENVLDSLMPKTADQWLGLTATMAVMMTPPGEAVAATSLLAVGGEELLATALDAETNSAIDALATTATGDVASTASQNALDQLAQFTPRQAGATLDIGNGVTVTQIPGNLNGAGALVFKGGDFQSVANYVKYITGYTGNLSNKILISQNIPTGATIYKIKTDAGYFEFRNITSSLGDWTIKLPNRLSNGIREIKFEF